jgi:DNA-binding MarR family transcriptional regulator
MTDQTPSDTTDAENYVIDNQIGFLLRRAHQRHVSIFSANMPNDLTPQQFVVLVRLRDTGQLSQNELGRQVAMDQSTINGVIQRMLKRDFVCKKPSTMDKRMILLDLTPTGRALLKSVMDAARDISKRTLDPIKPQQQAKLLELLREIC